MNMLKEVIIMGLMIFVEIKERLEWELAATKLLY